METLPLIADSARTYRRRSMCQLRVAPVLDRLQMTLAWGRDYDNVSPIKGVILGGGRHSVTVGVDVTTEESHATAREAHAIG